MIKHPDRIVVGNPNARALMAELYRPIWSDAGAPVLYTSTDQIQAHRNYNGQTTSPVAITIGGCTQRTYPPDPAELTLIATYETCRR